MCGIGSEHWQADLPLLQPLKQCWQHSCICFLEPASAPDAQHKDSTSLIDPCEACSEWNSSWKTSLWPWPLYRNSVPRCYRTSYSLRHLCGEQQLFAMRCYVKHPVVSMRELYSTNKILTALKQDSQSCMPCEADKTWTWWIGHVTVHG